MTTRTETQAAGAKIPKEALHFLPWAHDDQMTCRQVAILMTVRANPGLSTGAVAALLRLNKPTVTRAVDKLSSMGLVRRFSNTIDGRLVELWPTQPKRR